MAPVLAEEVALLVEEVARLHDLAREEGVAAQLRYLALWAMALHDPYVTVRHLKSPCQASRVSTPRRRPGRSRKRDAPGPCGPRRFSSPSTASPSTAGWL